MYTTNPWIDGWVHGRAGVRASFAYANVERGTGSRGAGVGERGKTTGEEHISKDCLGRVRARACMRFLEVPIPPIIESESV